MKSSSAMVRLVPLLMLGAFASSCSRVPFTDAYPQHYSGETSAIRSPSLQILAGGTKDGEAPRGASLSDDIVATLPVEFATAQVTGHLVCILDDEGGYLVPAGVQPAGDGIIQRGHANGEVFLARAAAFSRLGLLRFDPPGYPNVACFRPDRTPDSYYSADWFADWVVYLNGWESRQGENDKLRKLTVELARRIEAGGQQLAALNAEIAAVEAGISASQAGVAAQEAENLRLRNNLKAESLSVAEIVKTEDLPPFDMRRSYDPGDDPFIAVHRTYLANIADRDWRGAQAPNPFLEPTLRDALQRAYTGFAEPASIPDAGIRTMVQSLHRAGMTTIRMTSSSRTPWHQATVIEAARRSGNPAAAYYRSNHMFGMSADISVPFAWDSSNHETLRKVMAHFGLSFPVANDKVHVALSSPPDYYPSLRLAMARAFETVARRLRAGQEAENHNAIFVVEQLTRQRERVETDLRTRRAYFEERTSLLDRVRARYRQLLNENQALREEIRRREAERARDRRLERDPPLREPRDPGRVEGPREPPRSEPPRREPPQPRQPRQPRDPGGPIIWG